MASLYLRYRPTDFSEMIGNELALQSLQSLLERKDRPHVFLLSGPAGTGKSTTARIIAKKLGADDIDIHEINSSNNRGIDTAREIIQQMRMTPMSGDCTVYIIEECQKTTADFQNAMLRPLEETPAHVYFILCTTDTQKLIPALKTRCTEVKFSLLKEEQLVKLLKRVIKLEELSISQEVFEEIAIASDGCPRRALVLLEQVIELDEAEQIKFIKHNHITEDDAEVIELCRALLDERSNWIAIASLLKKLSANGKLADSENVRYAVLGYMNAVLLNGKKTPRAMLALEAFSEPTYNNGKFGITLACLRTIS